MQPSGWVQVVIGVGFGLLTLGLGILFTNGWRSSWGWISCLAGVVTCGFALLSHLGVWGGLGNRHPVMVILVTGLIIGLLGSGTALLLVWSDAPAKTTQLFIECRLGFPASMPAEGRVRVLDLFPIPQQSGGGGLGDYFAVGSPGEWKWPVEAISQTRRCQLTNYGSMPVFNVRMALRLSFLETIREDSAELRTVHYRTTEKVTLTRDWPIEIPKVDPGDSSAFVFYVRNSSSQVVDMELPKSVILEFHDNAERRTIPLKRSNVSIVRVFPAPQ